MRNADDDLVDRSSEKITPGSGISRCQEAKNPPLGGIIIILSSSHLIILIITYQIIVADAADAVSVNFSGRCKFLQI